MKLLITGGCGFLGSNLAADAIARKDEVIVFDSLYRHGAVENLNWLRSLGLANFVHGDIRSQYDVENVVRKFQPDAIFHLAGQVAMTTSLENTRFDFEVNSIGTLNLLEAIKKHVPESVVIYSSTNKVYGDLENFTYEEGETRYQCIEKPNGFDESTALEFHSPYGCSKGAADQYMQDFARMFGLKTVVFRHSSMYGGRQFATVDQGWVGWFCSQAVNQKNKKGDRFTISGNGKQVRDVLHGRDMIQLYRAAVDKQDIASGQVFNIGGGIEKSLSILELFSLLESYLGIELDYEVLPVRSSDQRVFVADITKAQEVLGWNPIVSAEEGVAEMIEWVGDLN